MQTKDIQEQLIKIDRATKQLSDLNHCISAVNNNKLNMLKIRNEWDFILSEQATKKLLELLLTMKELCRDEIEETKKKIKELISTL